MISRAADVAAAPFRRRALAALLYALLAPVPALAGAALVLSGLVAGGVLSVTPLGPWLIAATVRGASGLGAVQRRLAGRLLGLAVATPVPPGAPGAFAWRRAVLGDRAGWRAVGAALATPLTALLPLPAVLVGYVYGVLLAAHPLLRRWNRFTVRDADGSVRHVSLEVGGVQWDSWPRWLVPCAVGLGLLAAAPWLVHRALAPQRALLRSLLGPDAVDRRIRDLEETRTQAVDDAAATLRRIERDLHDGTQARLVGLGMHLTVIRELVLAGAGREQLLPVLETARGNAKQAVADLRDLVRGIHPPALDSGLATALETLAADCPLPVEVTVELPRRPSPAVESIGYFCAAELLANAVKHSDARQVRIAVAAEPGGVLRLAVRDDGRGGAVLGAGSGLSGLRARARTVDGSLTCDSPRGGPTEVTVRLPF
ncbi:sensor histidine kinase [Kitasatospora sp. NPDC088346]|uniref:sensor histidine kinase n=1 Tax=Kitasatospora sp. NPDC088346 TaxID=3364073 RepID=UPI003830401D